MIKPELIEAMVDKWDMKNRAFRFGMSKIFPTIKEYGRLIGVPHDCEKVILPCFDLSFKEEVLRTLGVKKKLLVAGVNRECKRFPLDLLCDLYRADESYNLHKSTFLIDHQLGL